MERGEGDTELMGLPGWGEDTQGTHWVGDKQEGEALHEQLKGERVGRETNAIVFDILMRQASGEEANVCVCVQAERRRSANNKLTK